MSQLSLRDIASVLEEYRTDFGFLDVFADDVVEIAEKRQVFTSVGEDRFRTRVGNRDLDLRMFRDKNVARFHLTPENANAIGGFLAGAAAGAALGAVADSDNRRQAPAGVIFGLLLGGILGGVAGASTVSRPARAVLTLRYDASAGEWRVYHGPYLSWAKEALRAE